MSQTHSEDLISLSYLSTAAPEFRESDLTQLLRDSRRANLEHHLTGMLLFRDGRFFQTLEGARATVKKLLEKIERDPRHHDLRVVLTERIPARRFSDWSMGYERLPNNVEPTPYGFRQSFEDVRTDDDDASSRAAHELNLWFKVRAGSRRRIDESQ